MKSLVQQIQQTLLLDEYRLGFTGPRREMNPAQHDSLRTLLQTLPGIQEAHHGDCVGADTQFHHLCLEQNIPIHLHPPTDASHRSFCQGATFVAEEQGYLKRNRALVKAADILVAVLRTDHEVQRSGIWASIRYARKARKLTVLVQTDGTAQLDFPS